MNNDKLGKRGKKHRHNDWHLDPNSITTKLKLKDTRK